MEVEEAILSPHDVVAHRTAGVFGALRFSVVRRR
jgi:hypothetical protein